MRGFRGVVEIFNAHASSAKNTGFGDALRREWKPEAAALLVHLNEMRAFRPERGILRRITLRADERVVLGVYPRCGLGKGTCPSAWV
jgi:hypothetical protein